MLVTLLKYPQLSSSFLAADTAFSAISCVQGPSGLAPLRSQDGWQGKSCLPRANCPGLGHPGFYTASKSCPNVSAAPGDVLFSGCHSHVISLNCADILILADETESQTGDRPKTQSSSGGSWD